MLSMANLSSVVGGLRFEGAVMNTSGVKDTTVEEMKVIADSASCAIVAKTTTSEAKEGNPKPRYYETPERDSTLNSMGLPNPGYEKMAKNIQAVKRYSKKPVFASLRFDLTSVDLNQKMVSALENAGSDIIEVNLSTPNLLGKPQLCYDVDACDRILGVADSVISRAYAVKLSPFLDGTQQDLFSEMLKKHRVAKIVTINSPGNALMIDADTQSIAIKPKWGGYGGKGIKPIALGNIRRFYEFFQGKIPIIGVGGIWTGRDAFEHVLAGASLVEVGTVFAVEGPACFARINAELSQWLDRKGYSSISEAVGQAKTPQEHFKRFSIE